MLLLHCVCIDSVSCSLAAVKQQAQHIETKSRFSHESVFVYEWSDFYLAGDGATFSLFFSFLYADSFRRLFRKTVSNVTHFIVSELAVSRAAASTSLLFVPLSPASLRLHMIPSSVSFCVVRRSVGSEVKCRAMDAVILTFNLLNCQRQSFPIFSVSAADSLDLHSSW